MPTIEQINELIEICKHKNTSLNGINGGRVIGENGNSIFLPGTGFHSGTDLFRLGKDGYYGCGTQCREYDGRAYSLFFSDTGSWYYHYSFKRSFGFSVRPVVKKKNYIDVCPDSKCFKSN